MYKNYQIRSNTDHAMYSIKGPSGGPVPKQLTGSFTSMGEAYKAIDGYLNGLKKGKRNGKKESSS